MHNTFTAEISNLDIQAKRVAMQQLLLKGYAAWVKELEDNPKLKDSRKCFECCTEYLPSDWLCYYILHGGKVSFVCLHYFSTIRIKRLLSIIIGNYSL